MKDFILYLLFGDTKRSIAFLMAILTDCWILNQLFDEIITTSSNEGDWVLDCCLGSGTTAISCLKNNRNCIGIELDNSYFQIARDRVIAEETNQTLF